MHAYQLVENQNVHPASVRRAIKKEWAMIAPHAKATRLLTRDGERSSEGATEEQKWGDAYERR